MSKILQAIKTNKYNCVKIFAELVVLILVYVCGCSLSKTNNLLAFVWLFLCGFGIFLYYAITNKNMLDMRAVMLGVMTVSVGVCQLRISEVQKVWSDKTWVAYVLGFTLFVLGFYIFETFIQKKADNITFKLPQKWKGISYKFHPKRVYYATIFLAVMPIVFFCIQAEIKGFIPLFSPRYDAYTRFYTRLSIFINLVILAAPLAFWCLKNLELKRYQKVIMWLIIPLPTIIFQMMVQRGLFIWSICILLVMVYFESNHKWLGVSAICLLLVFGVMFSTAMRNIAPSDYEQIWHLNGTITVDSSDKSETASSKPATSSAAPSSSKPATSSAEPSSSKPATSSAEPSSSKPATSSAEPSSSKPATSSAEPLSSKPSTSSNTASNPSTPNNQNDGDKQGIQIKFPTFLYAPYYYVINGIENFNHLVTNLDQHSYGLRQFRPFTVILRFDFIKDAISQHKNYVLLPNSTSNIIYDFYYDFGLIGVAVEMFIFGLLGAWVQFLHRRKRWPAVSLVYGIFMCLCVTSFFAAWTSEFGTWYFGGTALLLFLYACFDIVPKKKRLVAEESNNEQQEG